MLIKYLGSGNDALIFGRLAPLGVFLRNQPHSSQNKSISLLLSNIRNITGQKIVKRRFQRTYLPAFLVTSNTTQQNGVKLFCGKQTFYLLWWQSVGKGFWKRDLHLNLIWIWPWIKSLCKSFLSIKCILPLISLNCHEI